MEESSIVDKVFLIIEERVFNLIKVYSELKERLIFEEEV